MAGAGRFEDLRIWQEARLLVREIYASFGNGSPAAKDWGFRDQIQRASISIMNNIAEGFERVTPSDFARMLDIAKGSAGEVRSLLYVAEDLAYLSADVAEERREAARSVSKGISALCIHLRK
jgi:four helix bundle protein